MKAKTMLAVVVALVCAGTLIAGNVCTWQGGSGKFSDANWDTAPVSGNGDTIYFDTTDGSPITVENDIADDFTVEKVQFAYKATSAGDCGKVTLTGKSLVVRPSPSKISIVWDHGDASDANNRGPEVDVDVPITFENWSVVQVSKNLTFNRKVTLTGSYLYLRWPGGMSPVQFSGTTGGIPAIYFKDEVYGPNTEIRNEAGNGGAGSEIYYHGKVSAKIFYICDIVWGFVKVHLCHPENSIGTVSERYAQLYLDSSPCLGADTAIVLRDNDASATVYATADDVVCDRVTCGNLSRHQTVGDNNASGKLTMRAKADGASGVNFTQTLSIVYDPQGDCTYPARRRARWKSRAAHSSWRVIRPSLLFPRSSSVMVQLSISPNVRQRRLRQQPRSRLTWAARLLHRWAASRSAVSITRAFGWLPTTIPALTTGWKAAR